MTSDVTASGMAHLVHAAGSFHRIDRVLPEAQELTCVEPSTPSGEALKIMKEKGYSQLPVRSTGGLVIGAFTHRSFAQRLARERPKQWQGSPQDLPVEDYVQTLEFRSVSDEIEGALDALDRDQAILVGSERSLVGVLTSADVMKYLHNVSRHFLLISEIELTLRRLIGAAASEADLATQAHTAQIKNRHGQIVTALTEMTFGNYVHLIRHPTNWKAAYQSIFGSVCPRVTAKLEEVQDIRNRVFHFKGQLSDEDHETLLDHRNWLLRRTRLLQEQGIP